MIKRILADVGDACEVNVDELHDRIISQLPAEKYLDLFHKMQTKIYGYPTYTAWNGGCGCSGACGKPDEENN